MEMDFVNITFLILPQFTKYIHVEKRAAASSIYITTELKGIFKKWEVHKI